MPEANPTTVSYNASVFASITSMYFVQKYDDFRKFICQPFRRKYFKNLNTGPRSPLPPLKIGSMTLHSEMDATISSSTTQKANRYVTSSHSTGHLEHLEDLENLEHLEHLEQIEHLEHFKHLEHFEHLEHLEHLEQAVIWINTIWLVHICNSNQNVVSQKCCWKNMLEQDAVGSKC
jgi:hypothetical protein